MKTKLGRPVLTEINDDTQSGNNRLFIDKYGQLFINNSFSVYNIIELQLTRQQLIFISLDPDEEIKKGDKFYHVGRCEMFTVHQISENGLTKTIICEDIFRLPNDKLEFTISDCKKVIATQDQLSPVFIKHFVEEYNKNDVKDVEIEMESNFYIHKPMGKYWQDEPVKMKSLSNWGDYKPKLTNGFVTIVEKKSIYNGWLNLSEDDLNTITSKINTKERYYTENEVWNITYKAISFYLDWVKAAMNDSSIDKPDLLEWFNEHKKK
jgi:hypothetical protein